MPRRKGRRKKRRTHVVEDGDETKSKIPRSFVIRRGDMPPSLRDLVPEMRRMLMPHTALHLKERKHAKLKDYFSVAGKLGVSHFWLMSCTEMGGYVRVGRFPQGPTLTFFLEAYTLARDVRSTQRRPVSLEPIDMKEPPLLVLNNFSSGPDHVRIMATVFENMFPKLDVKSVVLTNVRRVILVDYDSETSVVSMRHYMLRAAPTGLSRTVRSMVLKHKVPELSGLKDIADIADGAAGGYLSSDSEGEGGEESQVLLPQDISRVKRRGNKTSLRLKEVGPRLSLKLVKVEEQFCQGEVFYHAFIHKSEEEVQSLQEMHEWRRQEKERRRKEQEENVRRKEELKKKRRGQSKSVDKPADGSQGEGAEDGEGDAADVSGDSDSSAAGGLDVASVDGDASSADDVQASESSGPDSGAGSARKRRRGAASRPKRGAHSADAGDANGFHKSRKATRKLRRRAQ
mmetsp:Transcript_5564/g.16605  ORF Transcript_5564/g.16605 Transcript_5564/m.16605 type:complete len:457 (+) Transcript_5564:65-1435(+)